MKERNAPRVALFAPDLAGGGAERVMLTIADLLVHDAWDVDLVLIKAQGALVDQVPPGVRMIDLGARRAIMSLPGLVRYLRAERPAAVLATLPHANVVLVWARVLARTQTRIFVREASTPSIVRRSPLDWRGRAVPWMIRWFYPLADGVIAVSEGVATDLATRLGVPRSRIHVIHNPVVGPDLPSRANAAISDPYFEEGAPPVVLSVGRLSPEKDYATLLRAFARAREHRDATLVILGEGPERARLQRLVESLGIADAVRLPGFVPDPLPYMSRAAVYVLSSVREGLPGALIQAMACGCPVVSTDCPSGPAEVLEGGKHGRLVPMGDASRMAHAILGTLSDPPDTEGARLRSQDFSTERTRRALTRLLRP